MISSAILSGVPALLSAANVRAIRNCCSAWRAS
jgi:hypothetical protein